MDIDQMIVEAYERQKARHQLKYAPFEQQQQIDAEHEKDLLKRMLRAELGDELMGALDISFHHYPSGPRAEFRLEGMTYQIVWLWMHDYKIYVVERHMSSSHITKWNLLDRLLMFIDQLRAAQAGGAS